MKINKIVSILGLVALFSFSACSPEDDIKNPNLRPVLFSEDFAVGAVDNTILNTVGWENIAEIGTTVWKEQIYSGNAYAEFTSFQSGNVVNIGWLVSPKIDLDATEKEVLQFQAAQSFVSSSANSLEVLIATDYDGTNLTTANWQPAAGAVLPTSTSEFFAFINSGEIDLSSYTGSINIAFKVKGSGTNQALDGTYQIDNVNVYTKN